MPLDRRHLLKQSAVLLKLGVAEIDVERSANWVAAHLPDGADPATWIPSAADLQEDGVISEAAVIDSRQAWYASKSVDRKYRKLLDAREA